MTPSPVLSKPGARPVRNGAAPRHRGRVLALQALYERDLTAHDWRTSLDAHAQAVGASEAVAAFAASRVAGVVERMDELDATLRRHAPMWPLEQLPAVDRNVLRIALFELEDGATPPKVAINEAVELAKEFGGEGSARFVNGVLGASLAERSQKSTERIEEAAYGNRL